MLLEVGCLGFRLLRPHSDDCLYAFPWGQIHSWAHTDNRFSFRYFDDGWVGVGVGVGGCGGCRGCGDSGSWGGGFGGGCARAGVGLGAG